jgi:tRNA uridine 5-carboxymethylaminomethyl modification enzyme
MFTSRAEYRLLLREDNADRRLSALGERLGLVGTEASARVRAKSAAVECEINRLRAAQVVPSREVNDFLSGLGSAPIRTTVRAFELLRRPEVAYQELLRIAGLAPMLEIDQAAELETEVKYEGYVRRQTDTVERSKRLEDTLIPQWLDFRTISGLSIEVCERLSQVQPRTLGQAARMPGITPAAIALLAVQIRMGRNPKIAPGGVHLR